MMPVAAKSAERGLTYIVPIGAGSVDAPETRPAMPDIVFADGSSMPVHLRRYLGRVVVLNFWASWAGPCLKELIFLDRLQGNLRNEALSVVALTEDKDGVPAADAFIDRQNLNYLSPFADPGGTAARALGVRGLPTSFIIDKHGRLVFRLEGPFEWDNAEITTRIRQLMAER